MLRHVSIAVRDPAGVAAVLAELWDGAAVPSPPDPGGYVVFADDDHGSCIEIYPKDRLVRPGREDAQGGLAAVTPRYSSTHINVSSTKSLSEVLAIAERAGWPARIVQRDGGYRLATVWIEGDTLLEVVSAEDVAAYVATHNSAAWRARLTRVA